VELDDGHVNRQLQGREEPRRRGRGVHAADADVPALARPPGPSAQGSAQELQMHFHTTVSHAQCQDYFARFKYCTLLYEVMNMCLYFPRWFTGHENCQSLELNKA
jgi:hypothetical protein